jgi:shikimate dehydrogenase
VIANRTLERARLLKEAASALLGPTIIESHPLDVLLEPEFVRSFDWIVQTASAEMGGGRLDIRFPRNLSRPVRAVDLVYHPPLTPFLKAAKQAGASIQNGLPMLMFQGLLAFWLFFGKKVKKNPRLLLEALEKRARKAL